VALEEGASAKLPHLSKIKTCAWLLQSEAINQASHSRTDASTKALLAGVSLARSVQNEPLLISFLVENSCLSITFQGLEQALTHRAFTEDQLLSLQAALRDAESYASCRRALVGERAEVISHFQMSPEEWAKAWTEAGTNASQGSDMIAYRKTPAFQQDFDFALGYFSNLLALAELPFPQCLDAEAQGAVPKIETAVSRNFLLSKLLLPALGGIPTRAAEAAASIRTTRTALAIERYRLKHANALPGSLSELAPELLDALPADPFDGQPLRYRKLSGKGYIVYSIGKDRKDDNGADKSADGKPLDVPFTVQR
jgi:hypothetical protein